MIPALSSLSSEQPPVLAESYEELRRCALHQNTGRESCAGMALLVRSGMAAWMEACEALPKPSSATPLRLTTTERFVPDGLSAQVASLLADMALSVHACGVAP